MSRMNGIQKNLFQLLIEFDEICKKNDIEYLLAAGASLGAIRNRCFMPWDDDIDLYITRDNWNKLRHLVETKENIIPEGRSLVYNENTPYYCNPLPRYVDTTTTTMYVSQALAGEACGQHLELFIMDPMPKGEKEKEEYLILSRLYCELLSPYFVVNKNALLDEWQAHYKLYKKYCKRIDKEGEEVVLKELEDKLFNFSAEECDEYCMRWGIKVYRYNKKHFKQDRYATFEGKEFPVGTDTEGILRTAYGDSWMYVPDTEEQISHNSIQSSTRSFREYTNRYIPKINRKTVFKKYHKNKRNNASVFYYRKKLDMLVAKERVAIKAKQIKNDLDSKKDYLYSLLENKNYNTLNKEFNDYIKLQMNEDVRKYSIIVPISDKNLKTLILSLIEQGQYYNANKYLNLYKTKNQELTKEFKEIEEEISACRELSIARYDEKNELKVQRLINKYIDKYPDLLDLYRAQLWINENNAKTKEDYEFIDKLCENALKLYPFDGEIMATQAKAKAEIGKKEEAEKLYIKSINNTRNGLIWQKVEDETSISRIEIERDIINGIENEYLIPKERKTSKTKQDIELELLQEFDEICSKNDLKYILTGKNALNAYINNTFKNTNLIVSVAMTQGDINRFCKIIELENRNDRYIEGVFNNPKHIDLFVSYGNENTANFNVVNFKPNIKQGINIRIYPIMKAAELDGTKIIGISSRHKRERKFRKFLNKRVENKKLRFVKSGLNILNKAYDATGSRNRYYIQIMNNTYIDKWEDIQNYSMIRIINSLIDTKYLKNTKKIKVDYLEVPVPKEADEYFNELFYDKKLKLITKPGKYRIIDTEISYKQIIKETEEILKEAKATHERILLGRIRLIKDKESVHNVWRLVQMTEKQINFMNYFKENNDYIFATDLDDDEEFKKLEKELKLVIRTLKKYSKFGFTFSINPQVDELIERILLKQGNKKLVKKMKKLSQKKYFIE